MVKRSQLIIVGIFFILLHPFYLYILNTFNIYQMPLTLLAIIFLCTAFLGKQTIYLSRWILLWVAFFILLSINNVGAHEMLLYYFIMALVMIFLSNISDWEQGVIKVLFLLTLPHALATIIFFFFPQLYQYIKPFLTYQSIFFEGYKTALTGHYTTNSVYISIGLIIIVSKLFVELNGKKQRKLFFLSIVYVFALILTTKRGPLIFAILSLFITYVILDKRRMTNKIVKIIGIIFSFGIIFYILSWIIPEVSEVVKRFSSDGTSGREIMYALAFSMFKNNILLGSGTGSYKYRYAIILAKDPSHKYLNVHNVYIQLLCENGILGFMFFILLSFGTMFATILLLQKISSSNYKIKSCLSVALSYQIFFLLYCLTENPLYDNMLYIPYFILVSVCYLLKNKYIFIGD